MGLAAQLDSFPALLVRAWRWGRRLLIAAVVGVACVATLELVHLGELLGRIHPWLGWGVPAAIVVVLGAWIGRAVWRYGRAPRVIVPPELPPPSMGWRPADLERYRRFAERYLERQLRNRHLPSESRDLVPGAIEAIRRPLDPHVAADPRRAAEATVERVGAEIDRVLEPLDREARRLIRRAAVDVAVVTGVTPSVLLDGLITLARNLDLISRLADLYYGRPGLFGTLRVVRDVLGAAAAAGAAEIVSEHVTSTLAEMTGSWGARLLGPIGQATINGVLTMRLGAAARMRCRSLRARRVPWNPISRAGFRKAAQRLYAWIAEDLGPASSRTIGVWTTWLSARDADGAAAEGAAGGEDGEAGGTATAGAAAPGGVLDRLRRRWRRRREEQDGDGEDDGSAGAIEPLIDGGLLEE